MRIGLQGENLIFVISQPRAGSTVLQRILGGHPDIHTVSEPWLMLHPLYSLRTEGYQAEYDEQLAGSALQAFLQTLAAGENEYIEGVRRMYSHLYERALVDSGKHYFLDKTPRYYFVIPELYRVFPQAHYIILLRNPLAVLSSIISTWINDNWFSLQKFKHDLVQAPHLLLEGAQILGERSTVVHYERLVRTPETPIQEICNKLGISFLPRMVEYGGHDLPRWPLGDQEEVYQNTRPAPEKADEWVRALEDPEVWRLSDDYLKLLGQETVEQMGYRYEELREMLEVNRPHAIPLCLTFCLAWLLKKPLEERRKWECSLVRLARSLRQRGVKGTLSAAMKKVVHTNSK